MKNILIIFCFILVFAGKPCLASDPSPTYFKGIEVLNGFGWTPLKGKGEYHLHALTFAFNFDLKPLLEKRGLCLKGFLLFQIEPYAGWVSRPENNIEIGNGFMVKWGIFPEKCCFQPYIKAGLGGLYLSQTTHEQSTSLNFYEQAGLGGHYFITKNIAVTAEGLYRHLSNGGIKEPNGGINIFFVSIGFSKNF